MLTSIAQLAITAGLLAVAPMPDQVELETKSFGTVRLDHAAHVARRVACASCHGPGTPAKLGRLAPRDAHARCVTCHKEAKKGPTSCRQCHAVKPSPTDAAPERESRPRAPDGARAGSTPSADSEGPPPGAVVFAKPPSATATLQAPSSSSGPSAPPTAASSAPPAGGRVPGGPAPPPVAGPPGAVPPAAPEPTPTETLGRVVEVGCAFAATPGRRGIGPEFRFSARQETVALSLSLDWVGGSSGRVSGLAGGGLMFPLQKRWSAHVLLLGGFEAILAPVALRPALGVRGGVEYLVGERWLSLIGVSATGAVDLGSTTVAGERIGGAWISLTLSGGWAF